ncbi:hypothetical protein M0802_017011 [Mischocyttarus mexicanus]|nr:hypothetical protein M0802_017011 [Mischocyttarus mexicanus]
MRYKPKIGRGQKEIRPKKNRVAVLGGYGGWGETLQPTDPPIFEVMNIIINETATQVAIWGNLGIAIMELPKRWGKDSAFQGGKDIILCTARTGFAWTYQEPLTAVPPNPYFKTPD